MTRIGSLCSGYEGLGVAIQDVIGGDLAFVADNDPGAAMLLAHHYPAVKNLGDITGVDWGAVEPVEVLGGGFPCTDVSAAGRRAGLQHDNRSGVWHEFVKAIAVLRPGLVVIENVLGLLTARGDEPTPEHLAAEAAEDTAMRLLGWLDNELNLAVRKGDAQRARGCRKREARVKKAHKRAVARCQWHERRLIRAAGTVLADLAGLGYDAEWVVVTASAAGACHRRARIFILAFPNSGRTLPGEPVAVIEDGLPTPTVSGSHGTDRRSDGSLLLPGVAKDLALLPTPSVADGTGGHTSRSGDRKGEPLLGGIAMLLPTPTANVSGRTGEQHMAMREAIGRTAPSQLEAAAQLLPTPSAGNFNDGEDLATWEARRQRNLAKGVNGNGQGTPLPVAAQQIAGGTDWGPYEAAIRRWEAVTGRQAPPPTVPGKTGERLNPALPEFMMGLPEGWITGVPGLSRNAMLKLAGNGCVPQQVALALRILLGRAGMAEVRAAA